MKTLINKIIDYFFKKKRVKKQHKPLTNQTLSKGLADSRLVIACIKSRNNNFVSKMITRFSGPYSHVVTTAKCTTMTEKEHDRLVKKISEYYSGKQWTIDYLVLASADDNGMNYFDISQYENREMTIFNISCDDKIKISIIHEFLSEKVMNMTYDYTGLIGQIFRKFGKWFYSLFDDERAYYCSEQAEIFKRHGVKIADVDEPTPTEIYNYCLKHYPIVYSK